MLNPVNLAPGNDQYVTSAELKSFVDNDLTWTGEPDKKFYLAYDFNAVNNLDFHDPEHYPIFGGKPQGFLCRCNFLQSQIEWKPLTQIKPILII